MKPFTLSRRRVLLILANYFAGYLFVYPMLIGLLYSLLEPLGVKNLQAILENASISVGVRHHGDGSLAVVKSISSGFGATAERSSNLP
ncbi:MAG: hypothetical protein ACLSA6_07350 [Holdemania massiliensis]